MSNIIELLLQVKTPLILGGIAVAFFYFIIKALIKSDKIGAIGKTHSFKVLTLLVNRFFLIAVIAVVLGFIGYMLPYVINENNSDDAILVHLSGLVIDEEGKPVRKVMITVDGKRFKAISTADGKYADSFTLKELNASVTVRAHNKNYYTFETVEKIPSKEHILNIVLNKK